MYYTHDADAAYLLCALANERFIGCPLTSVTQPDTDLDRVIAGFEVRAGQWDRAGRAMGWGVWVNWRYEDKPELGRFGNFVPLDRLRRLQSKED